MRKRRGRGEGGVHQLKTGLWQGKISLGYGPDGKRIRRSVYADSKAECLKKVRDTQTEYALGRSTDAERFTVEDVALLWLNTHVKPAKAYNSYRRCRNEVNNHIIPLLGTKRLAKLEPLDIVRFSTDLEKKSLGAAARRNILKSLSAVCEYAVSFGKLSRNPCKKVARPRAEPGEMRVWDEGQAAVFVAAVRGHEYEAAFLLGLLLGLRVAEILGLQWHDIDWTNGTIAIRRIRQEQGGIDLKEPKTKQSRRTLPAPRLVLDALRAHRERLADPVGPTEQVFHSRGERFMTRKTLVNASFLPLVRTLPIPLIRFHDLRHTHATLLLRNGFQLKLVSERLGHSSPMITLQTYAHVLPGDQAGASDWMQHKFGTTEISLNGPTHGPTK